MNPKIILPDDHVRKPLPGGLAWVAELRRPDLPQIKGRLKSPLGECCLGVLCRLQGRLFLRGNTWYDGTDDFAHSDYESQYKLSQANPLGPILRGSGSFVALKNGEKTPMELTGLNDIGYTFPEIADIIEQVWDCQ